MFFLDPDGLKLEGMKYGEAHRKRAAKRKKPKADKGKPKQLSAYKLAQGQSGHNPHVTDLGAKKS